jgi:hypothetical protein
MPWPFPKNDDCKHIFNYDGINISFSGLELPDQILKFKIGSFNIKKDLLQAASDIAQIYDLYQYSNCQRIKQFSENSPQKEKFIFEVQKNETRLTELLAILKLAAVQPSEQIEKSLADWVAFIFTNRIREEAPLISERVRAGENVREPPPIEEYNSLKRNIAKAKISIPYLKDALKNPPL